MLGNVYSFEYLGSRLQGDGDDEADVRYRMDIAQAAFASLSHLWTDHRLSRSLKLRLYNLCVCSTLTHSCEAWNLTKAVSRILNGFNNRCLHVITGEEYRVTAISPAYNLLLSVRQRRLRYLGRLLRLPLDSVVRRTLIGLYRDVWIAAIASSTTSLATRTAAICVRFQGRRVRRVTSQCRLRSLRENPL